MGDMAFAISKGPGIQAVEDTMNGASNAKLRAFVRAVRAAVAGGAITNFLTAAFELHLGPVADPDWPAVYRPHLQQHWYGIGGAAWWINLSGPVELIMAEGLCRAAELMMRADVVASSDPTDDSGARLGLDISWICPAPQFQVQLGVRTDGRVPDKPKKANATVRMVVLTPACEFPVDPTKPNAQNGLASDITTLPAGNPEPFAVNPTLTSLPLPGGAAVKPFEKHRRLSWIVSTQNTTVVGTTPTEPTIPGDPWPPVWNIVTMSGPVVTVSPAFEDGGVRSR